MDKLLWTDAVKNLLTYSKVQTDHAVFRLHYKITATMLLVCSILVSGTQFFGEPIHCATNDVISTDIMNNYCWVEGTFTLPRSLNGTLGDDVAAPGVDQRKITANDPVIEHAYYQWVGMFLLFQAVCFYFPRWLWRCWEQGRMKALVKEISTSDKEKIPITTRQEFEKKAKTIIDYFLGHRFENQKYAYRFFVCEILTCVNLIFQLYLLDRFLGYQFWTYGPSAVGYLMYDPENRVDPMAQVFPKMSKCRLRRFGTSGEVQIHDAICLLSLNIINEKIFVALWFWFVVLAIISFFNICYRLLMLTTKNYRYLQIKTLASMIKKADLDAVRSYGTCGDWFMLSLLKENVKAHHFRQVVTSLSSELAREGKLSQSKKSLVKNQHSV